MLEKVNLVDGLKTWIIAAGGYKVGGYLQTFILFHCIILTNHQSIKFHSLLVPVFPAL